MLREDAALAKLTETERKIVEFYLDRGGKAKDIATKLGVSERTVYKALYKYRKALRELGLDPSPLYLRKSLAQGDSGNGSMPLPTHGVKEKAIGEELVEEIVRRIREVIVEELERMLRAYGIAPPKPVEVRPGVEKLLLDLNSLLSELNHGIRQLNSNIEKLILINTTPKARVERQLATVEVWSSNMAELPSYVIDNPWVKVLSERR